MDGMDGMGNTTRPLVSDLQTENMFTSESSVYPYTSEYNIDPIKQPPVFNYINGIVSVVGLADNLLVMVILLLGNIMKRNVPNLFLLTQSAADAAVSVLLLAHTYYRPSNDRLSGVADDIFCRLWLTNGTLWAFIYVSVYNMLAMTFDRYAALVVPLWHAKHVTRKRMAIVIAIVWVVVFGVALIHPVISSRVVRMRGVCEGYMHWGSVSMMLGFLSWMVVFMYVIPLVAITYTYSHIYLVLKRNTRADDTESQVSEGRENTMRASRYKLIKLCHYVNVAYDVAYVCFTMNSILVILIISGYSSAYVSFTSSLYHVSVFLVFANSCMYPFVYLARYPEFRAAVMSLCCPCLRGTREGNKSTKASNTTDNTV